MKRVQFNLLYSVIVALALVFFFVACEEEVVEQEKPKEEETEREKFFVDIRITKLPDRTTFRLGEEPDFSGMEVVELYTDGSKKPITDFEVSCSDILLKKGTTKATVTARNRNKTFNITFEGDLVETGLPVVYITTENNAVINSKENYVNATMTIKEKGKEPLKLSMRIRGRGNATWTYPKKPYRIKLDEKSPLLGMNEHKDWVLLANYCDKSLLRTGISFKLSELMQFAWTPDSRFVEVVLNDEYMGNYQLVEQIKRDKKRVNIPKNGYLFERDNYYQLEPRYFVSSRGYGFSFKNPDPEEDLTDEQWRYLRDYMNELEAVLASDHWNDPETGYPKYIDMRSFALWFIFNNILANIEPNVYMTKDDMGSSKIVMGPMWDFEWSLGIGWYDGPRPRQANYYVWNRDFYFDTLLKDPAFKKLIKEEWQKLNVYDHLLNYFDKTPELLDRSQKLNFRRWDILNIRVSVGGRPLGSYEEEVACDRQFFINHYNWLNGEISKY
ncbi:MAG: CotH kinase family protein [Bacteroidota bacterium]|nr:CotH kinase family protein [Bacteroidota bacterium]